MNSNLKNAEDKTNEAELDSDKAAQAYKEEEAERAKLEAEEARAAAAK